MSGALRRLRLLLVIVILVWGSLALLARLATPFLENYRQPVENWLSEQLQVPVGIGELRASWYGIGPRIKLQQLQIGSGEHAIRVQNAAIDIAPGGLFADEPLNALRLTFDGLDMHVLREASGEIHLRGLSDSGEGDSTLRLPGRVRLLNTRVHWQDLRADGRQLTLDGLNLELRADGRQLRLRGGLDNALGRVRLAADIQGEPHTADWSGNSYLEVDGLQLAELLRGNLPEPYRLQDGTLQLRLWQQWQQARPTFSRGQLQLSDLQSGSHSALSDLKLLRGDFDFTHQAGDDWTLSIDQLQAQAAGSKWPGKRIVLRRRDDADGKPWLDAAADRAQLALLAELALPFIEDAETRDMLAGLQPRAALAQLRLRLPLQQTEGQPAQWAASGNFSDLSSTRWQDIPGIDRLSGEIAADAGQVSVGIRGQDISLDATSLFRESLPISRLQGQLHWLNGEAGWQLLGDGLDFATPDFKGQARLLLSQPQDGPTHMKLSAEVLDGKVAATSRYLPASLMGEELVSWLDSSLSSGNLERVRVLVDGPLDDFPFDTRRSGSFEVVALTRNTPLDYQRGWPGLREVDARLEFHENSLDIFLLKGRIYDSELVQAHARILSLDPTSSLLMKGRLKGPLKDEITLLGEEALRDDFGHIASALKVKGQAELSLDFEVPLVSGRGEYQLDGSLRFIDASMRLPEWELAIDKINGELGISLDALRAKGIRGFGLGAPLRVDVSQLADGATRVRTRGKLHRDTIARQLPMISLKPVSGAAEFTVDLDIPGLSAAPGAPTMLRVGSDLQGMQIDLPAPLGKPATAERPLQVSLAVAGKATPLRIDYNNALSGVFSADGKRGELRYKRGEPSLPDQPGLRLLAEFEELDLAAWQAAAAQLSSGETGGNWHADIIAGRMLYDSLQLPRANLVLEGDAQQISGGLLGPELEGRFRYPLQDGQAITVQLNKAYLKLDNSDAEDASSGAATPPQPGGPDPRSLPPLRVECADLRLNELQLGRLLFVAEPDQHGLQLRELNLSGGSVSLSADGSWQIEDGVPQTTVHAKLDTEDLGRLLLNLGYPRNMRDAPAHGDFILGWPGHPGQAHAASIAGTADISIGKGRLSEVDPGITKVLGLLSLDALTRRLKLDFSDVLKKGYSFDSINTSLRIEEGQAYTTDLRVKGPSGRINMGGRIGLVEKDFDQLVTVVPDLDATLPIATTLAGGPVAGVATLLAQTLMSEEVDKINRFDYSITGSWDEPKLTPLDSGGPLSRLVNSITGQQTEAPTDAQNELRPQSGQSSNPLGRLFDKLPTLPTGEDDSAEIPLVH